MLNPIELYKEKQNLINAVLSPYIYGKEHDQQWWGSCFRKDLVEQQGGEWKKMALDIGIKTPLERIFNGDCDELNMIIMHYGE